MNPVRKKILKLSALSAIIYIVVFSLLDGCFAYLSGDPFSEGLKPFYRYIVQGVFFFMIYYFISSMTSKELDEENKHSDKAEE